MKTIEDYLKDLTAYDVPDGAVENALINVGVTPGSYVEDLTVKQRDLCSAWLYWYCATTPSVTSSKSDSDNGWSHVEGSTETSAYDKRLIRQMANDIFKRYGVNVGKSTLKLNACGMRIYRRR